MLKVKDWLEGIPSKSTRKSYRNGIRKFEEYYGQGIETLIGSENAGKAIEKFYVWLKEKGYAQNTCRNVVNAPIQFLKFFNTPVKYRRSLGMYKTVPTTRDHRIAIGEVQSMTKVADLREQILLEVFLLGLRIGDVSKLEWETFDVSGETPIPIMVLTRKEEVVARTFISEEFKELLNKYLQTIDKSNPYLFQSTRKGHLTAKRINAIFKDLGKRAQVKTHGLFRWHIGRKLFLRTCAELGVNQWNAKMMCGKAVSADIATYVNDAELEQDFLKVSKVLSLFPDVSVQQTEDLRGALRHIEDENRILKTRIDEMQKDLAKVKETVERLYPKQVTRHILQEDDSIRSWTEEFATPEEYIESTQKFVELVTKKQKTRKKKES